MGTTPRKSSFPKKDLFGPPPKIDQAQPLYLQADQLLYDTKNSRVIAQGNVEVYYNNYILTADQLVYDQSTNKLIAEGNAQLKDPNGSITRADRFEALDDFRDAFIQSLSVVTADDTRIVAERANRREGNTTEYERAKFTPCKNDPGVPPLWCISAARIIHDQRAATITYQDAQFEFFGVPVVYVPYFEHPDPSVKHRSGFLMPSYANSSTLGFGFEIPYYFALSPTFDFTLHPRYWSNYGVLWQGDWRQRLSNGQYTVTIAAHRPGSRWHGVGQWRRRRLARIGPDPRPILPLVVVAVRMGRHGRQRRQLPPLLPARSDPADRPRQHRLSAGHERPQLLQRQALPVRRPAAHRHPLLQFLGAPGHRLQLHPRLPGARRRAELHRACAQHDPLRR